MNIADNFILTAERLPDKPFVVGSDGLQHTYSTILSRARRFASLLELRGACPGDRIILTFANSADYISAYLGSLFRGCTVVPVDFRSRPRHVEYVRKNCGASLWVSPRERAEYNSIPDHVVFPTELEHFPEMSMGRLCAHKNPLALIMYTSGATGIPKGVCLSHGNLLHTIHSIISWAHIDENDRELTTLSLTHLFGLAHVHVYWTLGGTVFIEEKLQDLPKVLQKISQQNITSLPGTPAGFKMILDQFAGQFGESARKLKYIIVNSAPMAKDYIEKILDLLPDTRFYMYYGLTEASRTSYICYNEERDKLQTVGRPTPGTEIRVGSPTAPLVNEVGEILVRGAHVTQRYWGMDANIYFTDGWFRTGDLGIMDTEGFLTWKGRLKEQINIDGLKLTPMEVEAIIMEHPRVKDCAVVGAPDELTGECVIAFVVAKGVPDKGFDIELRRFCKSWLEVYKIPRKIVFVEQIPRTDTGKTKRLSLREKIIL